MRNNNVFLALVCMTLLAACTPSDVQYCRGLGVNEQSPEYSSCMQYYHQQEAMFGGDFSSCAIEADMTYPPTLYDNGHTGFVRGFDPYQGFTRIDRVDIPPDPHHNAQVDALRSRIIHPCMDERGWNSPYSWQAGRHAPVKQRRVTQPVAPMAAPLPWLQ